MLFTLYLYLCICRPQLHLKAPVSSDQPQMERTFSEWSDCVICKSLNDKNVIYEFYILFWINRLTCLLCLNMFEKGSVYFKLGRTRRNVWTWILKIFSKIHSKKCQNAFTKKGVEDRHKGSIQNWTWFYSSLLIIHQWISSVNEYLGIIIIWFYSSLLIIHHLCVNEYLGIIIIWFYFKGRENIFINRSKLLSLVENARLSGWSYLVNLWNLFQLDFLTHISRI